MWGWNPAEMRDGTNSDYFIKLARQNGARVVCIDPRQTPERGSLADEWIPIRPGTDAAMMSAMAYVMITEELYDAEFVRTHCVGFDASQMPPGAEGAESYSDYILGVRDGMPKTPEWAEAITAVPRATIARIAREYATIKPGGAVPGLRHAAPRLRRAGGARRLRAGRDHRQRGHSRRLGQRVGRPGAGWRPVLERLPGRRKPGQGEHPGFPVDARRSCAARR